MGAFFIPQALGGQLAPGQIALPSVAAVDTNFLIGAMVDGVQSQVDALALFEQNGTMLLVPSKAADELIFRIESIAESRYFPQGSGPKRKFGMALAGLGYERSQVSEFAQDVLDEIAADPYILLDTTIIDIKFALRLYDNFGIVNADGQILSTAIRHGVCDIISNDGDFARVPNINQWTTLSGRASAAQTLPVQYDPGHWEHIAPAGFFPKLTNSVAAAAKQNVLPEQGNADTSGTAA